MKTIVQKYQRCPNCGVPIVNPKRLPYLLCRGKVVPLAIRHTFTPEPTEHDKEIIAEAHKKIASAKKLDKAWPGALITEQEDGHLHFKFEMTPESKALEAPISDIQEALHAAGWELVDPTIVEPDCVSGRLREIPLAIAPQIAAM